MIKAIVPIKLSSARLKNKSVKIINNIPLVEWTVKMLNEVEEIDEIIIYCSDKSIKNYIKSKYTFIERDKVLDRDDKNIQDILSMLIENDNIHSDHWVLQHVTSPFIKSSTVKDIIENVISDKTPYDSGFTVTKHQKFSWYMGAPLNFNLENVGFTQLTEPVYIETSGPFMFKEEMFLKNNTRIGISRYMKVVPFMEGIDIDNTDDYNLAKIIGEVDGKAN